MATSSFKSFTFFLAFFTVLATVFAAPYSLKQNDSPSPSPEDMDMSPDPDAEEVCVSASYVSKYARHELVHAEHIMADVLCPVDSSLPCATSNHMVRVNGLTKSYSQYCELNKCAKDKMEVNSVLSHIWQDEDHGNGVQLTMFDVRHPEMVQKVLHRLTAVRRGIVGKVL